MRSFFILTLITSISHAKAVIAPLGKTEEGEVFVTLNDLNQLKIFALIFAVGMLWNIVPSIWKFFSKKEVDIGKRMEDFEKKQNETYQLVKSLEIHFSHLKADKLTEANVREIVRDEHEYISRFRKQKTE